MQIDEPRTAGRGSRPKLPLSVGAGKAGLDVGNNSPAAGVFRSVLPNSVPDALLALPLHEEHRLIT